MELGFRVERERRDNIPGETERDTSERVSLPLAYTRASHGQSEAMGMGTGLNPCPQITEGKKNPNFLLIFFSEVVLFPDVLLKFLTTKKQKINHQNFVKEIKESLRNCFFNIIFLNKIYLLLFYNMC